MHCRKQAAVCSLLNAAERLVTSTRKFDHGLSFTWSLSGVATTVLLKHLCSHRVNRTSVLEVIHPRLSHLLHGWTSQNAFLYLSFFTRHSLVWRRARYLVYSMFVCLFVCLFVNDFSTTRGPIHAKVHMQAYSGSGCVFSPFGG